MIRDHWKTAFVSGTIVAVVIAVVIFSTPVVAQSGPQPPTNLTLSTVSGDADKIRVAYTPHASSDYAEFRLVLGDDRAGPYYQTGISETDQDGASPVDFDSLDQGYWYKVFARSCVEGEEPLNVNRNGKPDPDINKDSNIGPKPVGGCSEWGPLSNDGVELTFSSTCIETIGVVTAEVSLTNNWTSSCASTNRTGRYARFYSFYVSATSDVEIDLTSTVDTYMFLLEGSGTGGTVVESDDDGGDGYNSQITRELTPGLYTVEATTYSSSQTGAFALNVDAEADCVESRGTIIGTDAIEGSWASDCESVNRSNRYARFYSFSLRATSDVQIDLSSSVDTYLFLLGGVVKRVYSRSSLPGVGRWPSTTPFSWHNGSPLRATA